MMTMISTEKEYNIALEQIEIYLQKGSKSMTFEDKQALRSLSVLVETYEQKVYPMPMKPQSLVGMIQVKMFEKRLKQKELALLLEVSETTLSEIFNGKRKINLALAKQLYKKLGIAPEYILEFA
jgi:HTH-type transcriptional regulator / antitoxin HigA